MSGLPLEQPKHPKSPAGAVRERAVGCIVCRRKTANHCARCNQHCHCLEPLSGGARDEE